MPTYVTEYDFDTFGRLLTLKPPDAEVLTHAYDSGGNLTKVTGHYDGTDYDYLKRLDYDVPSTRPQHPLDRFHP